ncbi:hypothetical protein Nepgr_022243 [Nepenthes gracilis]|uniref:Uncharacterized protein n=1 Tax=Nepenthes gracilis TaxID=150966 RepID=A0AAD3T1L2_NEPGR|nr:hypothetical protein Nepgr_022243 [Nepenthes gracilis]
MTASAQQDAETPSAEVVGHAFVRQYYTILHQSPALVYRFYQDTSKLGRPGDNGDMSSTTTMDAINEKIKSYGALKADIKFVDAQESYNLGVIVLVTGDMIKEDDSRRHFTQTFFLAPQDKGYFVLNDLFRYVEDDYHHNGNQESANGVVTPTTQDHDPPPVQENHLSDWVEEINGWEVYNPSENGEGSMVEEEEPVAEVVDEVPNESQVVVEIDIKVEEVPKRSYASIVKVMKENAASTPSPAPPKPMLKKQEQQVTAAPLPNSASDSNVSEDGNKVVEADGDSIYVKNLPMDATPSMLEEAFKRFGPIKSGGIQVRSNKGFWFGFVEFEEPTAAQNAIEASPITIGGRQAGVEGKKSTSSRGNIFAGSNRGRFPPTRGGGFRTDGGGRGRGNYGGGRGYSRGDASRNEFSSSRGSSRGFQNRSSDGYPRNDHTGGNGDGSMNRISGSAG